MSRQKDQEEEEEEEEDEEEEEEDNECFYESFDRIISSNSCSTSNSDYDSDPSNSDSPTHDPSTDTHRTNPFPVPRFPLGVSDFDIWISEPASVSERRTRLLCQMGLNRDPSLSRLKPGLEAGTREVGFADYSRSVSSDRLTRQEHGDGLVGCSAGCESVSCFSRSKSDSAAFHLNSHGGGGGGGSIGDRDHHPQRNSSPCSCSHSCSLSVCPTSILCKAGTNETCPAVANVKPDHNASVVDNDENPALVLAGKSRSYNSNGGSIANAALPHKPPTGKGRPDSTYSNGSFSCNSMPILRNTGASEIIKDVECDRNAMVDLSEQACTIKNLDTGKKFVVKEIKEDGTLNKLKEVGTGRQLTMEEFEMCVGHSPIVQELMRRQNDEDGNKDKHKANLNSNEVSSRGGVSKHKRKTSWLKSIKSVANSVTRNKEKRNSDDKETSSGGRRSSSATDDSQDTSFHGPERVRVRQYGKSCKDLTALYKSQEIQAHNGSIWAIKFSLDGRFLATAGEDCVIHVWQIVESEKKGDLLMNKQEDGGLNLLLMPNGSPELTTLSPRKKGRTSTTRKSMSLDNIVLPDAVFGISEKPICSFQGHVDDVLDLSWSKSQHLLSSSMDKTVRLWHLSSNACLKVFSHSDYVTCIQFNPVDDRYFISGSLDAKVRIWSIPDRQVVDWNDLHEMVTAACYTPDGQNALVGSNKGSCRLYNTSENKLQQESHIKLQNKKKKAHHKKITGFQFAPGSSSEVLVTSADSRIRVIYVTNKIDLVHKFKGFRNTNSQISASLTLNGKYVVSASEDSYVYVWKYEADSRPGRSKGVTATNSYEHFYCPDVSVAIPWPGRGEQKGTQYPYLEYQQNGFDTNFDEVSTANHPPTPVNEPSSTTSSWSASGCTNSPLNGIISNATNGYFFDRISATWPEEKLLATRNRSPHTSLDSFNGVTSNIAAWGMVIVTAGLRGKIRTFQNFGLPVRI